MKEHLLLYWLGSILEIYFGPFRLLTSRFFLGGLSLVMCFVGAFMLLPRLMDRLPRDRGRAFAVQSQVAQGKPTGAGIIFVTVFVGVQFLCLPLTFQSFSILVLAMGAMLSGWFDDTSVNSWSEYKKGLIDLGLATITALVLCELRDVAVWLPFTKLTFAMPWWLFTPFSVVLIWTAINSTNCTDGVDGLSGTLTAFALTSLGAVLYFVIGHKEIADYLLVPHYPDGSTWGMMAFALVGTILGYLWYNANPSMLLMGDAGSRALGFMLGVFVIKTGNPFLIVICSCVLLINGGTGLVKVALLRFFKIAIFRNIRFPLHDHVRHNRGWSNPQVLVRFSVLQVLLSMVLLLILLKVR